MIQGLIRYASLRTNFMRKPLEGPDGAPRKYLKDLKAYRPTRRHLSQRLSHKLAKLREYALRARVYFSKHPEELRVYRDNRADIVKVGKYFRYIPYIDLLMIYSREAINKKRA